MSRKARILPAAFPIKNRSTLPNTRKPFFAYLNIPYFYTNDNLLHDFQSGIPGETRGFRRSTLPNAVQRRRLNETGFAFPFTGRSYSKKSADTSSAAGPGLIPAKICPPAVDFFSILSVSLPLFFLFTPPDRPRAERIKEKRNRAWSRFSRSAKKTIRRLP